MKNKNSEFILNVEHKYFSNKYYFNGDIWSKLCNIKNIQNNNINIINFNIQNIS